MEKPRAIIIFLALFLLGLTSCGFYHEKPQPVGASLLSPNGANISFQTISARVLTPYCISCHGSSSGRVSLETYASVKQNISRIERAVFVDQTMPKQGILPKDAADLLQSWIQAGALENPSAGINPSPTPSPEPMKPNFNSIKQQIIEKRCLVCHSTGGAANGVPLGNLADILNSPRDLVLPGNVDESGLWIAITRQDSKRMPPPETGGPLSQDEISVIKKWIELGAPEVVPLELVTVSSP